MLRRRIIAVLAGLACAALIGDILVTPAVAQTPPASGGPVDPAIIEDLVAANRILADQGVLDGFGHVSVRHPNNPNRFLLSRSLAPALTTADDIIEYDLDCTPINDRGRGSFLERFIHGEIYKARPDVKSVIHTHSPAVIPFGASKIPMQAMYHVAGFLVAGMPVFEIRKHGGMTNMLISNSALGKALADTLGDKSVVLMRGHGDVVVGPTVQIAVYRAVYTEVNARLQMQAMALGGEITYLEKEEGEKADVIQQQVVMRPWDLWKKKAMMAK
jgi:HCOMODA/2-hydroxy-3-carboxy-muconic semialdehyde decarboxylase